MKKSKKDLPVDGQPKIASKAKSDLTNETEENLSKQKANIDKQKNEAKHSGKNQVQNKFSVKPYLRQHKWGLFAYVLLLLVEIGVNVPFAIIPAHMIVAITQANYVLAFKYAAVVGVCYMCTTTTQYLSPMLFGKLSTEITMAMSLDIAEQAFKISSNAYANHQTGSFLQRIRSDPDTIFESLTDIIDRIAFVCYFLVIVIYLLTLNFWSALLLLGYLGISFVLIYFRNKTRIKNRKEMQNANESVSSLLTEVVRSERDIKSLNLETNLKGITKNNFDNYKKTYMKTRISNVTFNSLDRFALRLFIVAFYVIGILLLDKGFLTLATFLLLYENTHSIKALSENVASVVDNFADLKVSYERINELYADDEFELEKFGTVHRKNLGSGIEFRDVGFAYTEYKTFSLEELEEKRKYNKKHKIKEKIAKREVIGKKQVFENLSFKIEPNTTVAFVGKSGCGKSTVLNLISKIYTVDSGKVLLGGIDINKLDKSTLRSSISLVNQFPYIFDMTIKENLLLAKPDATDEEIDQVLKDAALDEFIAGLTEGLNTKVGESGMKLSGGQKQRLAIARALLKKSNVIILDESTSSLDNLAQNTIKESIDRIKGKSTIIIVAHRLSTIKNVDKIFFMDDGKIVDTGTFAELNKTNKTFKTMYNAESIEN